MQRDYSRRRFLKTASALGWGGFAAAIVPSSALGLDGQVTPSNRITLGNIGVGGEGTKNLRAFLAQDDARVVAVCEVDRRKREQALKRVNDHYENSDCKAYGDFREIIHRRDIDAVMISTPDHWHVPMALMALRAGKDVICEKPTLTIAEGRKLSDVVRQSGRVFQTSTEDRGVRVYHRMAELIRNGRIGKLKRIAAKLFSGPVFAGDPTPQPVPPGFDYEMWLGPAPWAPYCPARTDFNFRWITDYSGGMLTDWGAHLLDTAQWASDTERTGPVEVEGTGKRHTGGLYNTFYNYHLRYQYANGMEMFVDSAGLNLGLRFEGTAGWIGNDGWMGPLKASSKEIQKSVIGPGEVHLYTCAAGEHRNFLDCVKSRKEPYNPAETGHRCSTVMHIGNIAMELGRKLHWDPVKEQFVNDDAANRYLSRTMRQPWTL